MPGRIVIYGNSGAGKSTLARALAERHRLAHLDLDTLAWQPGATPPQRMPLAQSRQHLYAFQAQHARWVMEGCYGDLVREVADADTLLVFLNPGIEACLQHCRRRPWEPHKYASAEAQQANLGMLLDWVRDYPLREDACGLRAHRQVFDQHRGPRREIRHPVQADEVIA
ncbi:shikimate kinase [Oleiagrimonas sp. C23AA]|uniref:AAA family ATPase n=1 Tax=Oleiagrimonas sp. C23AA TaxID=2719047 RepID=UPI001423684F|nr:shikimate kinase [Oleiagrimonas sp. C23AA]NII10027.1 shikimate kinase [Oleiagrimonas sp. C23AA]